MGGKHKINSARIFPVRTKRCVWKISGKSNNNKNILPVVVLEIKSVHSMTLIAAAERTTFISLTLFIKFALSKNALDEYIFHSN